MNDNKKIALNTIILYLKLIISIIIGLYTSRIILLALGIEDYGLYSVIGGIVTIMNFLGSSMLSTSYRFIAIEMGKGENGNLNKIYNTVLFIHIILSIFLIILGETVGVYYINNYLNVNPERIPDALFVLHLSLISSAFVVISFVALPKFPILSFTSTLIVYFVPAISPSNLHSPVVFFSFSSARDAATQ